MKKNPTKPDAQIDDDRLYAPAWASERSPPGEAQTPSPGLPVASTTDPPSPDRPTPSAPSGMAKGIGGPNVECPPRLQLRPRYGGDIAGNELRRRSSHESEVVPEPPLEGPPRLQLHPGYGGDIAGKELRHRSSQESEVVPEPPIEPPSLRSRPQSGGDNALEGRRRSLQPDVMSERLLRIRAEQTKRRIARWSFLLMIAGTAAYGLTVVTPRDWTALFRLAPDKSATHRVASVPAAGNPSVQPATAPGLIVEARRAYANEPLRLGLSLNHASAGEFVLFKGLEVGTRLSAGTPEGPKSWRVSALDIGSLIAYAPKDYVGTMDAVVDLHSANDRRIASHVIRLEWMEKALDDPDAAARPSQEAGLQTPATRLKLPPDDVGVLLRSGQEMMKIGDIAAARPVLRRAAEAGNSEAAFLLASTFDPIVLREFGVIGLTPDVTQALSWYEKASELGSGEAKRRIERLGHIGHR